LITHQEEIIVKVVFRADNGKYLSRILRGAIDGIEAAKDEVDVFCQFEVINI
jgi:hypothetical protein